MALQPVLLADGRALMEEDVQPFISGLRGAVLTPDEPGYDESRSVRNGLINRHPALIVRCSGVADVIDAVNFARANGLLLSVRGGGHNVAGNAVNDGGLVIDLSAMRAVRVDTQARTVRAQGGATWADVDRETQVFGLATPGGLVSTTGVGGLTLHGGMGHLRRKYGLSIDSLLSVDIVTADGQVRTASADQHAELFWAVRGAGSNFGVVTSFEFALHPVGPLVALAAPMYPLEDAPQVLRAWREYMDAAPDEISSNAVFWGIPAVDAFPAEVHNKPVVIVAALHCGPAEEGERALLPLRSLATPVLDLSGTLPYTAVQSAFDPFFPKGWLYYWKSLYLDSLGDETLDAVARFAEDRPVPTAMMVLWHQGGQTARVGAAETAFGRRDAPALLSFDTTWADPADTERCIRWTRDAWNAAHRFSSGGVYLNFAGFGEEKEALVRAGYGDNYDRLAAIKAQYDPDNLFRMNQNIQPAR